MRLELRGKIWAEGRDLEYEPAGIIIKAMAGIRSPKDSECIE